MAEINLKDTKIHTSGSLPALGDLAPVVCLVDTNLQQATLASFDRQKLVDAP